MPPKERTLVKNTTVLALGPICLDDLKYEYNSAQLLYPGGNAVITASILAAMGIKSSILGIIGNDESGNLIRRHLEQHGVDISLLYSSQNCGTKIGHNVVDQEGKWHRDFSQNITVPYLPEEHSIPTLASFTHLHVGAITSLMRTTPSSLFKILSECRGQGSTIGIGLAGIDFVADEVNSVLDTADTLICNADEFCHLLCTKFTTTRDLITEIIESKYTDCVITIGEKGSIAKYGQSILCVDASGTVATNLTDRRIKDSIHEEPNGKSLPHIKNSVGAGDVFAGVFIASRLKRFDHSECLRAAANAAFLSVLDDTWDNWLHYRPNLTALMLGAILHDNSQL
jgi:sugar/nucleoside kinase (ribokinase family)